MKNDGHLGRNYLKGAEGDAMNVLLVACGHNLRKVLTWLRARLLFAWILSLLDRVFCNYYSDPHLRAWQMAA